MHVAIDSTPKDRPRRRSEVTVAFWMVLSTLTLLCAAMKLAWAAEAVGSAVASQQTTAEKMTKQEGQSPDGLMPCLSPTSDSIASVPPKRMPPRVKSAVHKVTFNNCQGTTTLTITRTGRSCMYQFGPYQISLEPNQRYQISMEDSNNYLQGCADSNKSVSWSINSSNGSTSAAAWVHSHKPGPWSSMVESSGSGAPGQVGSATCDGVNCLNAWAVANTGTPEVIISFE
ncbi:Uncharacterised protein [Pandoraea pulmonicola]|uniref:Uncharacterized protein n=1 Tax=Pandoraea pulmonicola TaxID=93221 RepID=A0AAJ4ZF90_PANPU|nr:Uncharacterised protein [Pandoraea pulmonicola]